MPRALALVEALVDRLRPYVPDGVEVKAEAGGVAIFKPDSPHAWSVVTTPDILDDPEDDRSAREKLEVAAYSVLNHFQDFIAEEVAEPWPGMGSQMPQPEVDVGTEEIRLWFGPSDSPVLELEPIPLEDLD
jgi:hypothetical protein